MKSSPKVGFFILARFELAQESKRKYKSANRRFGTFHLDYGAKRITLGNPAYHLRRCLIRWVLDFSFCSPKVGFFILARFELAQESKRKYKSANQRFGTFHLDYGAKRITKGNPAYHGINRSKEDLILLALFLFEHNWHK